MQGKLEIKQLWTAWTPQWAPQCQGLLGPDTLGSCWGRAVQACPPPAQPRTGLSKMGAPIPSFFFLYPSGGQKAHGGRN